MRSSVRLFASASLGTRPRLEHNLDVDVVVVGAGITGVTAALRLAEQGKRVVVLEARTLGSGTTSGTTAHITEAVDTRYTQIERDYGAEGATLVAESSRAAIEHIAARVSKLGIDCDFERVPGYLYSERPEESDDLRLEFEAARRAGLHVQHGAGVPLPFPVAGSVKFENQAQFDVGRYLVGLAAGAEARGVTIFEESRVLAVEDGEPCTVHLENGVIVRARDVFFATHVPLNRVFLQTKLECYRSYVIGIQNLVVPRALYWDTDDPYHYLRMLTVDGTPYLLVGGEDHRTGTEDHTEVHFANLETYARARFAGGQVSVTWSEQVFEPVDGLPFIGKNSLSEHVYVATGFSGNGMTFGTIAANVVADRIGGLDSPWAKLYDATRIKPIAGAAAFLRHNTESVAHLIGDHIAAPEARAVSEIRPDEGKTMKLGGERLAVYRDTSGQLHAVSGVCTHLGCLVKFNQAERSWDCPCHGSRFALDGSVISGPATKGLVPKSVDELADTSPSSQRGNG